MSNPVTVTEAALLARDQPSQPWQQAFVALLAGEVDRDEVVARIRERLDYAPRFRQLASGWPLAAWVDDPEFSVGGHVREVRLGKGDRLEDWLAGRLATPLAPEHPLWQANVVRGFAAGVTALVVCYHPALVDGYDHVHLLQELFDDFADDTPPAPGQPWQPAAAQPVGLGEILGDLRDPLARLKGVADSLAGLVENTVRGVVASARPQHVAGVEVDLEALDRVRLLAGCTIHDVLLALATAGVRDWLAASGHEVCDQVALVPLAVAEPAILESAIGCRVAPSWVVLPVATPSPAERLQALATLTRARLDTGVSVPARDLVDLAGFAPPTLHGVAAGTVAAGRAHSIYLANVPGPEQPRYFGSARVRRVYAVTATTDAQEVTVSITSYAGRVTLGAVATAPLAGWARAVATELELLEAETR